MRKLLFLPLIAAIVLVPAVAQADKPEKIKVTICHNVVHNAHPVTVSVNAVKDTVNVRGHGRLVLETGAFTPHDSEGHRLDFILKIGDEVVSQEPCDKDEPVEEPECPEGTTEVDGSDPLVCEKEILTTVTSIVEKEVLKEVVVEVPGPTQVVTQVVEVPVAAPAPAAPATPAPATLPHTGSNTLLPLLGAGLTSAGLVLRRLFR